MLTVSDPDFKFVPYPVNHDDVITKNLQTLVSHLNPTKPHIRYKKRNNSDTNITRFSMQVSAGLSVAGFLSRVRTTERLPLTYHTKPCAVVNICSCSPFTPFSHWTLKDYPRSFKCYVLPREKALWF